MKAIIFGASGQDAYYLSGLLEASGIEVIGVSRYKGNYITGTITDRDFVTTLIAGHQPHYIFHLAANSTTRHDALFENHETISTGTLNVLEAVYSYSRHSRVFLSGSGLQFVNKGQPISETDEFDASSPYCIARIQSVYAARYYRRLGVKVYVGYFFNHDSPRRSERHVNQKVVAAAVRIASGSKEQLTIGDIAVKKEFTFAGDIAKAIITLVNNEGIFEAIIGSGKAYSIEEWLDLCFRYFGLAWQEHTVIQEGFKSEYDMLVSNPQRIYSLGWEPKISISELAAMMIKTELDKKTKRIQ